VYGSAFCGRYGDRRPFGPNGEQYLRRPVGRGAVARDGYSFLDDQPIGKRKSRSGHDRRREDRVAECETSGDRPEQDCPGDSGARRADGPTVAVAVADLRKTVHVGFRRKPVEILKGVDLEVRSGEVFGLLGPNGAGKTTTLKVVLGLMRPTGGSVTLGVDGLGEVGYLPENAYFYDYLTGRELLTFCASLFSLAPAETEDRVEQALEEVGLGDAAGLQLRKYSKGMLQRIGIAQALINDPRLVFLDEPMTGLDPIGRLEVKRIIQRLHDEGRTVLFNSHILADVAELCSRVGIMRGGVVLWSGTVDEARPAAGGSLEDFFMEVVAS
jgi:ABC-2 type transport system ATP-binding protein